MAKHAAVPSKRRLPGAVLLLTAALSMPPCSTAAKQCMSFSEVESVMESEDKRPKQALTSVRIPGTASSKLFGDIDHKGTDRYKSYKRKECRRLCFDVPPAGRGGGTIGADDDPFVNFTGRLEYSHMPFDSVLARRDENATYLVTTIRDPFQYARKMYLSREAFDPGATHIHGMTFREWIEKVPWRANQMVRMLGREGQDERVWDSNNFIASPSREHQKDEYMMEQNRLGEESEVLERAWRRLSERMVWFGIFHRLKDSYDLLAFTFCRDEDWGDKSPQEDDKNLATGMDLLTFMRTDHKSKGAIASDASDAEVEELYGMIAERNRLDMILMERAEELLDRRMAEMRDMKARGVVCKFLGTIEVTCASSGAAGEL